MLSTMRTPKAKRACEDCHRRKRRCTHVVTENQQNPSDQLDDLSNHLDSLTTNKDNIAAMDREYDYDYNMNKSSATKRVRKGAQSQEPLPSAAGSSSAGPQGQERLPPAAGPVSSSAPNAAPVQAVFAGIPTTVPSPEDPVNMYDVEEFLSNLEVMVRDLTFPLPLFTTDRANNSVTEGHWQASP